MILEQDLKNILLNYDWVNDLSFDIILDTFLLFIDESLLCLTLFFCKLYIAFCLLLNLY